MSSDISLLVVGGGPAGVTAALQARELGARVTLLEAGQVGGTSLNRGPAPVRTLARAARLARDWSSWATFGLEGPPPVPNLPAVVANSERVARYAHDKKDMAGHLRGHGIDLLEDLGPAGFVDPHTLAADGDADLVRGPRHPGRRRARRPAPDPRRRPRAHIRGHSVPGQIPPPGRGRRRCRHRLPDRVHFRGPRRHGQLVRSRTCPDTRRRRQRFGRTEPRLPRPGYERAHGHAGRGAQRRRRGHPRRLPQRPGSLPT